MPGENEDICFSMLWGYTCVLERECLYHPCFKENSSPAVLGCGQ